MYIGAGRIELWLTGKSGVLGISVNQFEQCNGAVIYQLTLQCNACVTSERIFICTNTRLTTSQTAGDNLNPVVISVELLLCCLMLCYDVSCVLYCYVRSEYLLMLLISTDFLIQSECIV